MERLTKKILWGIELPLIPIEIKTKEDLDKFHKVRREYESYAIRLAEYEDTELTPEEIMKMKEKMQDAQLLSQINNHETLDKIGDILQAYDSLIDKIESEEDK